MGADFLDPMTNMLLVFCNDSHSEERNVLSLYEHSYVVLPAIVLHDNVNKGEVVFRLRC